MLKRAITQTDSITITASLSLSLILRQAQDLMKALLCTCRRVVGLQTQSI